MAASQALSEIIQSVSSSNLNFNVSLTPYSAYITVRKSFIKNFAPPGNSQEVSTTTDDVKQEHSELKNEIEHLLLQLNNTKVEAKTSKDTINILEEKVSKSEAAALKIFEERSLEIVTLKNVLKKKDSEISDYKKELLEANKALKGKEKEAYKLQQKNDNQSDSITRIKAEISILKTENKNLLKKKPSKRKSSNVSTNTLPVNLCNSTCQPLIPDSILAASCDRSKDTTCMPLNSQHKTTKISHTPPSFKTTSSSRIFTPPSTLPVIKESNNNICPVPTTSSSPWSQVPAKSSSTNQATLNCSTWPSLETKVTMRTDLASNPEILTGSSSSLPSTTPILSTCSALTTTNPKTESELQKQLNMLANTRDESLRKLNEKLNKIWEDTDKKNDEIFNKKNLEAEENYEKISN